MLKITSSMDIRKLERAIKKSWDIKTCHPDSVKDWSKDNSAIGQCGVSVLIIQDYFGGKIAFNRNLHHVWNVFDNGSEYDISRKQFPKSKLIEKEGFISREEMLENELALKAHVKERYELLKSRVEKLLINFN